MTELHRHAKQQQFLQVVDRDEAARRFIEAIDLEALGSEVVGLAESLNRILAADVTAPLDVPPFDRSNVDGFAVRAADTVGAAEHQPCSLQLAGEIIHPGRIPECAVQAGLAVAISTGGMLPRGADAVVMIEHADLHEQELVIYRPVASGAGITFAGNDIAAGENVLRAGRRLTSRETGVLAALGVATVTVWKRPRVAILSTGDELLEPGAPMQPAHVFDCNARMLADAVRELGGEPEVMGIIADQLPALQQAVDRALRQADVVLLSGGTSKGAGDLSYRVVERLKDPGVVAHGVALKPGKPLCLAATGGKPVVVLPGFPTSAIFTFHEFVAPVLRRLARQPDDPRPQHPAHLGVRVQSEIGRTEYLLVRLVEDPQPGGRPALTAYPMGKGSGSVTTFSQADGFVVIDRHRELVEAGDQVQVQLLGNQLGWADLVVMGSHCVGLDYLLGILEQRGVSCKFLAVGSSAGLSAVRCGQCDLAGIHLLDAQSGRYNLPFVTDDLQLVPGYGRQQGIVFRPDEGRFREASLDDLREMVRADTDLMMVNRNRGSGTRILIDQFLGGAEPPGYSHQVRSHNAVVAAVLQQRADWGVAIEIAARRGGLGFVPLAAEHYDFVVARSRWQRAPVQAFCQLLGDGSVRAALEAMGFSLSPP